MKIDNETIKLAQDLLTVYVCPEVKEATEKFLASPDDMTAGTLAIALTDGIASIDEAIAFAQSDYCKEKFGEEAAKSILEETTKAKKNGAKYCGCDGCQKALALLNALAE